jgi:alkanesulfonate monooxygenase SsuD/methylene tetrahydromethanopterin reductase-like flavin-dependent oxidoreductase (luciferase family)
VGRGAGFRRVRRRGAARAAVPLLVAAGGARVYRGLDIIIGKGNDPDQNELFGYDLDGQWDRNREKYELLRQLLRQEKVSWEGKYRPALSEATTQPRPFQTPSIPIWHGSASSTESTELAAKWGEPLFSANGFHPLEKYAGLIRHYRERWEAYGQDPADAVVGAGFNGLYVKRTSSRVARCWSARRNR